MNIANMKTLVGQLERLPDEKFWMPDYIIHSGTSFYDEVVAPSRGDCGTVACIAGWASLLNGGPQEGIGASQFARSWLGLDHFQSSNLFGGLWTAKPNEKVTRSEAIAELNRMIAEAVSA